MGLTNTLSKEFGKFNIGVNSVMPGAIATERQNREIRTDEFRAECVAAQSLKRDLMPNEVASVILFLAADDSSAVTDSSYVVDGGWKSSRQVPDILHLQPQAPPSPPPPPPSSSPFQTLQIHPPELEAREYLPTSPKLIYAPSQGAEYYARSADHSFRYSELRDEESISLTALNAALTTVYRWPY
ncbi:hypothetical protein DL768_010521 [Monosporascus sp. mg162]|nr:hypothetical protein DL768_010521 [Monosporascus sp. mg162]